jgi:potassium efflux system protein
MPQGKWINTVDGVEISTLVWLVQWALVSDNILNIKGLLRLSFLINLYCKPSVFAVGINVDVPTRSEVLSQLDAL